MPELFRGRNEKVRVLAGGPGDRVGGHVHDGTVEDAAGQNAGHADPKGADEDVGHLEENVTGVDRLDTLGVPETEKEAAQEERAVDGNARVDAARGQFLEKAIEIAREDKVLRQGTDDPHGCGRAFEGAHVEFRIDDGRQCDRDERDQQHLPPMLLDVADAETAAKRSRQGEQ